MRLIEKKMNKAIRSQENFRLDNTEVQVIPNDGGDLYEDLLNNIRDSDILINKIRKLQSEAENIMQDIDQLI